MTVTRQTLFDGLADTSFRRVARVVMIRVALVPKEIAVTGCATLSGCGILAWR